MKITEVLQPSINSQVTMLMEDTGNKFSADVLQTIVESGEAEHAAIDADDYLQMLMQGKF